MAEAFNLLQKSIIRVEEDDVDIDDNLDDENDEVMTSAEALGGMSLDDSAAAVDAAAAATQDEEAGNSSSAPSGKISITYEKFEQIKLMLAHKLRLVQQSSEEGMHAFFQGLFEGLFRIHPLLQCTCRSWNAS